MVFCPFFCSPKKAFLRAFEILPYKSPPVLRRGLGWYKIKIFQKLVLFIAVPPIPRLFMPTRTKKEEKAPSDRCLCGLMGKKRNIHYRSDGKTSRQTGLAPTWPLVLRPGG